MSIDLRFEKKIEKFLKASNKTKRDLKKRNDRKHGLKNKPLKKPQEAHIDD